jgi:hypothetical protein
MLFSDDKKILIKEKNPPQIKLFEKYSQSLK